MAIDRFVRQRLGQISWNRTRRLITSGKVSISGIVVCNVTARVGPGDLVVYNPNARNESTARFSPIQLLFVDSQLVVANKPAGISSVPFDEHERGTLLDLVRQSLSDLEHGRPQTVHVVHRVHKETSGIVVFARTRTALKRLKQMFRIHNIDRRYIALVHGRPYDRTFSSRLVVNRGDGRRGSTSNPRLGRVAVMHIHVLEFLGSGTLIECCLETGRTHQIRIQLAEAGYPLFGERVYSASRNHVIQVPRLMLHAAHLAFQHPLADILHEYSSDVPEDMRKAIQALRAASTQNDRWEPS